MDSNSIAKIYNIVSNDSSSLGRSLSFISEYPFFSHIHSVNDFYIIRLVGVLLFPCIFILILYNLKGSISSYLFSLICALIFFIQPSTWWLVIFTYGPSYLLSVLIMLYASYLVISRDFSFILYAFVFTLITLALNIYQLVWPMVFIGIFCRGIYLFNNITSENNLGQKSFHLSEFNKLSKKFIFVCAVIFVTLMTHLFIGTLITHSQRVLPNSDFFENIDYIVNNYIPMTVVPFLYFFAPKSVIVKKISFLILALTTITAGIFFLSKIITSKIKFKIADKLFIFSMITSFIPASLGIFMFTDLGLSFRRVGFASTLYWITVFTLTYFLLENYFKNCKKEILYLFLIGMTTYILTFVHFFYIGTVKYASNEWSLALCATRKVPNIYSAEINSKVLILDKIYPNFYSGDEFQSAAFSYPAGAALFWLSYDQYYKTKPIFSRWDVRITNQEEYSSWDKAYLSCKSEFGIR